MSSTMNQTGTPAEMYGLISFGRATINGIEWVAYTDGAYRHVVYATDWDRDDWPAEDGDDQDYYTDVFCADAMFADDATAIAVARACDLSGVHSASGTCAWLNAD